MKILRLFSFISLFTFVVFPKANGEIIKLLDLPSGLGGWLTYSVDAPFKCSFAGVKEITLPDFLQEPQNNIVLDKINFFQRKLNLEIYNLDITKEKISFGLKGARNVSFIFSFDKNCQLVREVFFENKSYRADEIDIEYSNFLLTPVLEKMTVKNSEDKNKELHLYPWALRGQLSSYELILGPAFNIHSNIRRDNQINFQTTEPVVEPIPGVFFRYGPFFINQDGMGSLVFNWKEISILALAIIEGEPYKSTGLDVRNRGVFLGGVAKLDMLQIIYYRDFFTKKGTNLKATLAPEFYPALDWRLSPQFSIQYWNKDYVNYYYGVKPEESLSSGLPAYNPGYAISGIFMFEALHYVGKWTFVNSLGMKFYGKEVYESPTVVRKNEVRFITSVLYKVF